MWTMHTDTEWESAHVAEQKENELSFSTVLVTIDTTTWLLMLLDFKI